MTDAIGGVVATVVDRVWTGAGQHTVELDGALLADGSYNVVVTARTAAGASVQKVIPLSVNRTLGLVTAAPLAFSPNGDGRRDRLALDVRAHGAGRCSHPDRARGPLGREPAARELSDRDAALRLGRHARAPA